MSDVELVDELCRVLGVERARLESEVRCLLASQRALTSGRDASAEVISKLRDQRWALEKLISEMRQDMRDRELAEDARRDIYEREIGRLQSRLASMTGERRGLIGRLQSLPDLLRRLF